MEDIVLKAALDDSTTLYVSPIDRHTYEEYLDRDNLGGDRGYFLVRSSRVNGSDRFEILAKAPTFDAAGDLFDLIVGSRRHSR